MKYLRPTKTKLALTVITFVIWYLYLSQFKVYCKCAANGLDSCLDYEFLELIHTNCHCTCTSFLTMILTNLKVLAPSIFVYLGYSVWELYSTKKHIK